MFTFDRFLWGAATVASRAYGDDAEGQGLGCKALCRPPGTSSLVIIGLEIMEHLKRLFSYQSQGRMNLQGLPQIRLKSNRPGLGVQS